MTLLRDHYRQIQTRTPVTSLHKKDALQLVRSVDKARNSGEEGLPAVKAVPQDHEDGWKVVPVNQGGAV